MFCSKCGTKNEEGSKFCNKCGEPLNEKNKKEESLTSQTSTSNDQGGIRKALKKDAKRRIKGSLIGATAVYLLICIVISTIFGDYRINTLNQDNLNVSLSVISEILIGLIATIFSLGISMACFKVAKNEEITFGEIFIKPFNKGKFLGYLLLMYVILFAIGFVAGLLMIIPILGFLIAIALIVALIYYIPAIQAFMLILADPNTKEDISFDATVKKALEIVQGNRVEYYGVTLSFIGWILLALCTFGILFIWLTPYIQLTTVNMYRKWLGEEKFDVTETGLSNGTVIGLTAGGCGCGCFVIIILFVGIIASIIAAFGIGHDNPTVQSFIDKYVPAEDRAEIEADFNEAFEDFDIDYNYSR